MKKFLFALLAVILFATTAQAAQSVRIAHLQSLKRKSDTKLKFLTR
ncbi:MAG: hypothetical protein IJP42_04620 [Selenomonadaceae bacterium]|nr:hypothetical protein [Quinella sp. 1Q5]MBQ6758355.1 hypothetical protein [Selenomonadaceae bacterium]